MCFVVGSSCLKAGIIFHLIANNFSETLRNSCTLTLCRVCVCFNDAIAALDVSLITYAYSFPVPGIGKCSPFSKSLH